MAARLYNSGSIAPGGDLGAGGSTHCYASDIANRLTGWVHAAHACCLNTGCYGGATTYASTPATGWWSTPTTAAIVPSWLSSTIETGATSEPSTYSVTIQPSVVSSVISAVFTDESSVFSSGPTGGIFAPISETFSAAPTTSLFSPEPSVSVVIPTSVPSLLSPPLVSGPLVSASPVLSTSNSSFTVPTLTGATPTSPPVAGQSTYVLTLGTQTVTYTVDTGNVYWATALSPYVYWAATSLPAAAASPTNVPSITPAEATPTTTISYEAASAAGLTPAASIQSLVARFAESYDVQKRASYDTHFTTMLVNVPVNVPVPEETKTVERTAFVTKTRVMNGHESWPTTQSIPPKYWSASRALLNSTGTVHHTWTAPLSIASSSIYAYATSKPSNATSHWYPTGTASSYPTGWGTSYPTGWSTGLPSGRPTGPASWKPWIWPNLVPTSSPDGHYGQGPWTVRAERELPGMGQPRVDHVRQS